MPAITLLLHNIRSTHNVGSIFRTADGFGIKRIILSGYTPYPHANGDSRLPHVADKITRQINKTALGAAANVPFEHIEDLQAMLDTNTLPLVALEQAADSTVITTFSAPSELILIVGEEVDGIERWILDYCDAIIEIPMKGMKESFNVSVATGVALYALTT